MDEVTVRRAVTPEDMAALHALRQQVFVAEQGVAPELERDDWDDAAIHALAYVDGALAATGRVALLPGGEARVGRMAVRADLRRRGIGARALAFLEAAAAAAGAVEMTLHAQRHAAAFYARQGYAEEGEPFEEAGIAHVMMRKGLTRG